MGNRKTKVPSIPEPTPNNLLPVIRAMKEVIEVAEKRRGDPLDAKVTYRDLVDAGIAKVTGYASISNGGGGTLISDTPGPNSPFLSPPDFDSGVLPGRPANVHTMAVWDGIQVIWDWPAGVSDDTYWARAVVWASATPSFTNATIVGYTTTNFFTHTGIGLSAPEIPGETTQPGVRYYWVAWEGRYNEVTGQNDRSEPTPYHWENGIRGQTAVDPTYTLALLVDGITESQLYQSLNDRIDLVDYNPDDPNNPFTTSVQQRILTATKDIATGIYSAIAAKAVTSVNPLDGMAKGEYSIRVDANGYVAGYGLSAFSQMNQDGTYRQTGSQFIVSVDRFAIVWPKVGTDEVQHPFTVGRINGVNHVGINGQLVVDGTITARHIQAGSIGTAQLNAQQVYADFLTANNIITGSMSTSVAPNYRVEINGFGSAKELYPLWYGNGTTGGSGSIFYVDKFGSVKLAGSLYVTGAGKFFCGNTAAGEYRLELGGPTDQFLLWAGTGTKSKAASAGWSFYIDNNGEAKFRGTVEAQYVSGEISRTHVINEYTAGGIQALNGGTASLDTIPEGSWKTISSGVNNAGYWECPAPPFAYGHVPYCHVTFNVYGPAQAAGAFRLQWRINSNYGWQTVNKSVMSIFQYGETKSLAASVPRVHVASQFRLQMAGFNGSRPYNSVRNGIVMGIR